MKNYKQYHIHPSNVISHVEQIAFIHKVIRMENVMQLIKIYQKYATDIIFISDFKI